MLEEDDSEWAMKKPGGLSSMVRDLLRSARKNEERTAEAVLDPLVLWETTRVSELAAHYSLCSDEGQETLLKVAQALRDEGQAKIYRKTADVHRAVANELADRVEVLEAMLENVEDYEATMITIESRLEEKNRAKF